MGRKITLTAYEVDKVLGKSASYLAGRKIGILVNRLIVTYFNYQDFSILDLESTTVRKSLEKPYTIEVDINKKDNISEKTFDFIFSRVEKLLKNGPLSLSP